MYTESLLTEWPHLYTLKQEKKLQLLSRGAESDAPDKILTEGELSTDRKIYISVSLFKFQGLRNIIPNTNKTGNSRRATNKKIFFSLALENPILTQNYFSFKRELKYLNVINFENSQNDKENEII